MAEKNKVVRFVNKTDQVLERRCKKLKNGAWVIQCALVPKSGEESEAYKKWKSETDGWAGVSLSGKSSGFLSKDGDELVWWATVPTEKSELAVLEINAPVDDCDIFVVCVCGTDFYVCCLGSGAPDCNENPPCDVIDT